MREIKFRVWDGCGIMTEPMTLTDIVYSDNNGYIDTQNDDFIFIQYTGLKDKNGKEIYEGDILTHDDEREYPAPLVKVIWYNEQAKFYTEGVSFSGDLDEWNGCEVIGNIYENPELLNRI